MVENADMRTRLSANFVCKLISVALVVSFSVGCATTPIKLYPGPALPRAQIATLGADSPIAIMSVDGEKAPPGASNVELQLLPGRHTVQFGYQRETCFYVNVTRGRECKEFYSGDVVLEFEAVPGHAYWIYAASTVGGWRPYIADTADGRAVARSDAEWPL